MKTSNVTIINIKPPLFSHPARAIIRDSDVKLYSQSGSHFRLWMSSLSVADYLNKTYWAVISCGIVYYAVQGGSSCRVCGWNPNVWPFKWKLLSSTFLWYCLLCCTRWFLLVSLWGHPKVWPFEWKLLSSTFLWYCLLCCTRWFLLVSLWGHPKVWPFEWKLLSSTFLWYILLSSCNFWVGRWNPKVWMS